MEDKIYTYLTSNLVNEIPISQRKIHNVLMEYLPYYQKLRVSDQKEFRSRTKIFIRQIQFRGGDGFKITYEHVVAIAGAFIQISFGVKYYLLTDFEVITIYPEVYKSTVTQLYHKGDVNPGGAIAISWKDFVQGYETEEDNLNVGLHEMAHAWFFCISHQRFDEEDDLYDILSKYIYLSELEIVKIRHNIKSIFRKYASENVYEFFAVSIEYFFEDAKEFKAELPDLYRHLCLLLNQDPSEGITRGIHTQEYFVNKNLFNFVPVEEEIVYPEEKLKIATKSDAIHFILILIYSEIFLAISGGIIGMGYYLYLFLAISIIFALVLMWNFKAKYKISMGKNYMIMNSITLLKKEKIAIHLDNILTVDLDDVKRNFTLKYIDDKQIFSKMFTANDRQYFENFVKVLVEYKLVLKKEGTRIPRLKSRNRWRK